MNNKNIIVTGGLGFIGSNLVKLLTKKGYKVFVVDKLTYAGNLKNLDLIKKVKIYKTDINNRNEIDKIIKKHKPSTIFNLAAETHVDRSITGPKNFIKSNILGVFNLLEVLRINKKKLNLSIYLQMKFLEILKMVNIQKKETDTFQAHLIHLQKQPPI